VAPQIQFVERPRYVKTPPSGCVSCGTRRDARVNDVSLGTEALRRVVQDFAQAEISGSANLAAVYNGMLRPRVLFSISRYWKNGTGEWHVDLDVFLYDAP
jgi:hypothetical protein